MAIQNLGLVQAISVSVSPPSNTNMLWRDISPGVNIHKAYNTVSATWEPLTRTSDYALSEHLVGIRWHDGKPIFRQIFTFSTIPPNGVSFTLFNSIGIVSEAVRVECYLEANNPRTYLNLSSVIYSGVNQVVGINESATTTFASAAWTSPNPYVGNYDAGFLLVEYTKQ